MSKTKFAIVYKKEGEEGPVNVFKDGRLYAHKIKALSQVEELVEIWPAYHVVKVVPVIVTKRCPHCRCEVDTELEYDEKYLFNEEI